MTQYLYRFGYEFPAQRLANVKYGWDDETSYAFFIEAETPEQALEWGREVSEAFCHYVYQESGWKGSLPSWKEDGYAHWIEDDSEIIAQAQRERCPQIAVGEIPDFAEWPDVL
jgi:hypothetical protein